VNEEESVPSTSRILKIIRNVLLVLAALVAAFFLVFVPWFFTAMVTHNQFHYRDPNDGKSPKSYNLDFRWIEFTSPDGVVLKGWYIPAEGTARGTIIYSHGLNRTRIEMLPDASLRTAWDTTRCFSICVIKARAAATSLLWATRKGWMWKRRFATRSIRSTRPVRWWCGEFQWALPQG
jgi:hypothetical protein